MGESDTFSDFRAKHWEALIERWNMVSNALTVSNGPTN